MEHILFLVNIEQLCASNTRTAGTFPAFETPIKYVLNPGKGHGLLKGTGGEAGTFFRRVDTELQTNAQPRQVGSTIASRGRRFIELTETARSGSSRSSPSYFPAIGQGGGDLGDVRVCLGVTWETEPIESQTEILRSRRIVERLFSNGSQPVDENVLQKLMCRINSSARG
jgi:hypothetical protein